MEKTSTTHPYSTLYKLTAIILDIGQHKLSKPVTIRGNEKENRPSLPFFFANKCMDAIHLINILHHKSVRCNSTLYQRSICSYHVIFLYFTHCTQNI